MLKNIIAPVQAWLLAQKRCVGCGIPLSQGVKNKNKKGHTTVLCKCKRIYIEDPQRKTYRRALLSEV